MAKSKALATTDYSKYAGMGMKNITSEDIRPPMLLMVNKGIVDKSELVDEKGQECPDGHFYIKSFKEVLKTVTGYIVWVKKDHFRAGQDASPSDQRWDGVRMYRAIFIRKDDHQLLAITFKKSSLGGLNDLLTFSRAKNLPIFLIEVELEALPVTNKKGQSYFKTVANVIGIEKDVKVLDKLFTMAQGFDSQSEVKTEEDVSTKDVNDSGIMDAEPVEPTDQELNEAESKEEDVSDDVPF